MASAQLRINQPLHSTSPTGQAGVSRDDLEIDKLVRVSNVNDVDVVRWRWRLLDKPIGSIAVITDPSQPSVTFTPDVEGSYLLRLSVNDGLEGEVDTGIAAVKDPLGRRYPATGEQATDANWEVSGSPNQKGWGKDAEFILRGLGVPQLLNAVQSESPTAGSASEHIIVAAFGLPQTPAAITGYEWIDLLGGANVGPPPGVNGVVLSPMPGFNGLVELCVGDWDLDATGTTAGDQWGMIVLTLATPLLLARLTMA